MLMCFVVLVNSWQVLACICSCHHIGNCLDSCNAHKKKSSKFQVGFIDSLPEMYPVVKEWVEDVLMDEGNATILTLFACLVTVLYLRERQRRQVAAAANPQQHDDVAM